MKAPGAQHRGFFYDINVVAWYCDCYNCFGQGYEKVLLSSNDKESLDNNGIILSKADAGGVIVSFSV